MVRYNTRRLIGIYEKTINRIRKVHVHNIQKNKYAGCLELQRGQVGVNRKKDKHIDYIGSLYVSQQGLQINNRPGKTVFIECLDEQEEVDTEVLILKYIERGNILIKK